ncbi:MAG: glycerol kinase GlpK [Actinomycetales bacterium]|nr:glycerol kinase GlpK [Actinomycetales bacterium]
MTILALDAGTTGVTALVIDDTAQVVARGYREFPQYFPADGWVEHDPAEIWTAVCDATAAALSALDPARPGPTAIGVTNQRETLVVWDRRTLRALRPAIVWQDRRTAGIVAEFEAAGHGPLVTERTGLRLDPYFTASKATWLLRHEPKVWDEVRAGRAVIGTVDSYLLARMSAGAVHVTDASNASRTLLFNITTGTWDEDLCAAFGVPLTCLPEIRPSIGMLTRTDPGAFGGLSLPVTGLAGDQQASLYGHRCLRPGQTKCTYGTGAFLMQNTGAEIVRTNAGLLTTVAWQDQDGRLTYALEGAVFVAGAAVSWLRDGLGIVESAEATAAIAGSVADTGGVVMVPALTGLGAPDWDPHARGLIIGITRATTAAHIVRATLAGIAHSVRDVVDLISSASGAALPRLTALRVDGGAASNAVLCQMQADLCGIPILRSASVESTAIGAALLAGVGAGIWGDADQPTGMVDAAATFHPGAPRGWADAEHARWRDAVARSRGWAAGPGSPAAPATGSHSGPDQAGG